MYPHSNHKLEKRIHNKLNISYSITHFVADHPLPIYFHVQTVTGYTPHLGALHYEYLNQADSISSSSVFVHEQNVELCRHMLMQFQIQN